MPIEVEPNGIPVQISEDIETIQEAEPTTENQIVIGDIIVLPSGYPIIRKVDLHGFPKETGGNLSSVLISQDDKEFMITLVPLGLLDLPQGINEITIDGVTYRAVLADPLKYKYSPFRQRGVYFKYFNESG